MMSSERLPYRFTPEQVDCLATVVGDHMDMPEAFSINNEIGIAPTRALLSTVQNRILDVLDVPTERIVLMLTDHECLALLRMGVPQDIAEEIGHVLP